MFSCLQLGIFYVCTRVVLILNTNVSPWFKNSGEQIALKHALIFSQAFTFCCSFWRLFLDHSAPSAFICWCTYLMRSVFSSLNSCHWRLLAIMWSMNLYQKKKKERVRIEFSYKYVSSYSNVPVTPWPLINCHVQRKCVAYKKSIVAFITIILTSPN